MDFISRKGNETQLRLYSVINTNSPLLMANVITILLYEYEMAETFGPISGGTPFEML